MLDGIDGGYLLAARSSSSLCFYDWETTNLIRRIEIAAKRVYWSDNGEMVIFKHTLMFLGWPSYYICVKGCMAK